MGVEDTSQTQIFILAKDGDKGPTGFLVKGDTANFQISAHKDQDGMVSPDPDPNGKLDIKVQTAQQIIEANGGNQFAMRTIDMRDVPAGGSVSFIAGKNGHYSADGDVGFLTLQEGIVNTTKAQDMAAIPDNKPAATLSPPAAK